MNIPRNRDLGIGLLLLIPWLVITSATPTQAGRFRHELPNPPDAPKELQEARRLYNKEQFAESFKSYEAFIKRSSDTVNMPIALFESGIALMRQDKVDAAIKRYFEIAERYPDAPQSPRALFYAGELQTGSDRWIEAEETFGKLAQGPALRPETIESRFELVRVAIISNDRTRLAKTLRKFIEDYPGYCSNKYACQSILEVLARTSPSSPEFSAERTALEKSCANIPPPQPCNEIRFWPTRI